MIKPLLNFSSIAITKWAYQKSKNKSVEEWNEEITVMENADLLLTLASDVNCPKRASVLRCLYTLVGKGVSKHIDVDIMKIKSMLDKANTSSDVIILNWVQRSRIVLKDLRKFDYIEWCQGGLSEKDLPIMN